MKRLSKVFVLLALAIGIGLPGMVNAAYIETFTSGNANWNYGYGTNFVSPQVNATQVSTGGNPGGYISGAVTHPVSGNGLYAVWTYDTTRYGNMAVPPGLSLRVDTRVTDGITGSAQFYVGKDGTYFVDGVWDISKDTSWTRHTTSLTTTEFTLWTGSNTNLYTLAEVLAAPDDIGIFFGGMTASGGGQVHVDNFGTSAVGSAVPIPAAFWLLGSGLVGLVGMKRRIKG